MSFQPPFIPPESLAVFLKKHFPLRSVDVGSIVQFDGYDDRNYYFSGELKKDASDAISGNYSKFVIKFVNSRDSKDIEVLKGLSKLTQFLHEKDFKCPYPIPSNDCSSSGLVVLRQSDLLPYTQPDCVNGGANSDATITTNGAVCTNPQFCLRVTVYVEGELFGHGKQPPQLLRELGCYVGRINSEMMSFSHPAIKDRVLNEWDLKRLLTKREVIPVAITDPEQAKILYSILDDFEKHVSPIIYDVPGIKRGYIHCDINCLNIVINKEGDDPHVSGLIDFSNAVYAPLLFELGISMAYLMMRMEEPAVYVKPFLEGYLSVVPLSDATLGLLYYVVLGRLAQSYLNGMYTHKLNPSNKYVLVETAPGWELIKTLLKEGKHKCYDAWNIDTSL